MIPADFLSPMFSLTFQEGWDLIGYKSVYLIIPGILQIAPSLRIYSTNILPFFLPSTIFISWFSDSENWIPPQTMQIYIYYIYYIYILYIYYIYYIIYPIYLFAIQPCILLWNLCQLLNSNAILGRRPTAWLNHQKFGGKAHPSGNDFHKNPPNKHT